MDWSAILNEVIPYLLTLVFAWLANKYLTTEEKKQTAVTITKFAEGAVLFVEDIAKNSPDVIKGTEKLKMAIEWVKIAMKSAGYPVPDEKLIEGEVAAAYQRSPLAK